MGTYLRLPQKHRFNAWLSGFAPEQVWKRTAADLAAAASEELGFAVTPNVVAYARRCLVPKPLAEPGLVERMDALEANHESLKAWAAMRIDQLQLSLVIMGSRLAELEQQLRINATPQMPQSPPLVTSAGQS